MHIDSLLRLLAVFDVRSDTAFFVPENRQIENKYRNISGKEMDVNGITT